MPEQLQSVKVQRTWESALHPRPGKAPLPWRQVATIPVILTSIPMRCKDDQAMIGGVTTRRHDQLY